MSNPRLRRANGLADSPEADDAEGGTGDPGTNQQGRGPALPATLPHEAIAPRGVAAGVEHQRHGDIGGGFGEHAGGVGRHDLSLLEFFEVQVVHADGVVRNDFEVEASVEHAAIDRVGEQRD